MPLKRVGTKLVRQKYDARWYTLPPTWIDGLRAAYPRSGSRELLADYEGPFMGWAEVRRFERGGKQFVIMMRNADDQWALELELTDHQLGEMRALPPDENWELVRELDAQAKPPIELEG